FGTLSATSRSSCGSCARYTVPNAPAPSFWRMTKRPIDAGISRDVEGVVGGTGRNAESRVSPERPFMVAWATKRWPQCLQRTLRPINSAEPVEAFPHAGLGQRTFVIMAGL